MPSDVGSPLLGLSVDVIEWTSTRAWDRAEEKPTSCSSALRRYKLPFHRVSVETFSDANHSTPFAAFVISSDPRVWTTAELSDCTVNRPIACKVTSMFREHVGFDDASDEIVVDEFSDGQIRSGADEITFRRVGVDLDFDTRTSIDCSKRLKVSRTKMTNQHQVAIPNHLVRDVLRENIRCLKLGRAVDEQKVTLPVDIIDR